MHNLFVVRTPLQLLSAYIIADQIQPGRINDLILINPRGKMLWESSYCLKRMVTDKNTWHKVIIKSHRIARRSEIFHLREQLRQLKTEILEAGDVECVYLGADREFDNQLLVELVGKTSYVRMEDGMWSYDGPYRTIQEKITMFIWSRIVKLLTGIHTGMQYNYTGGGYGQAAIADYLFKPQLLQHPSPKPTAIPKVAIHNSLAKLTEGMPFDNDAKNMKNAIVFLGSVFVDKGILPIDQELSLLKALAKNTTEKGIQLWYKPHPFEKKEKLSYYQAEIPELFIIHFSDPIEFLYYCFPKIPSVISYASSGLLYADLFSEQPIKSIALFKMFPIEQNTDKLDIIMKTAGVLVPNTKEELTTILS